MSVYTIDTVMRLLKTGQETCAHIHIYNTVSTSATHQQNDHKKTPPKNKNKTRQTHTHTHTKTQFFSILTNVKQQQQQKTLCTITFNMQTYRLKTENVKSERDG